MAENTLKIVIPMAGLGTRLRPQTWSKPKQLISVAGKAVLGHVLDMLRTVPDPDHIELINIVGYLGEQIEAYMEEHYPELPAHYVVQENPRGQSHAIHLAQEYLSGPMLMIFADTLIETDLHFLQNESADAVAWVKSVPDPRRFGVAIAGEDGYVRRLVEKPKEIDNNLAVVGCYYFKRSEDLIAAIEEQMRLNIQLKGEFFLADAINLMLEKGLKMRIEKVDTWLDAGTPEAILKTNRYLLKAQQSGGYGRSDADFVVVPPVFIHPSAKIERSVIGPYAAIGAGCSVVGSIIRDSILEDSASIEDVIMEKSIIGRFTKISRRPEIINAGDNSILKM